MKNLFFCLFNCVFSMVHISVFAKENIGLNERTFRMLSSTEFSAEDFFQGRVVPRSSNRS